MGVNIPNSLDYEYWENYNFNLRKNRVIENINDPEYNIRLVGVDLHSSKTSKFWDKYSKLKRNTNLNYIDLLGSYELDSCTEDFSKNKFPVYKKVLDDGTEAYLYKKKFGIDWMVRLTSC